MISGLFALGSTLYFLAVFSRKYRPPVIIFVMRWRRGWIAVSKETSTSKTIRWNTKFYPKIRWFKGMQYCFSSKVMLQIEEPRSEEWFLCGYGLPKLEAVQILWEKFSRNQLAVVKIVVYLVDTEIYRQLDFLNNKLGGSQKRQVWLDLGDGVLSVG